MGVVKLPRYSKRLSNMGDGCFRVARQQVRARQQEPDSSDPCICPTGTESTERLCKQLSRVSDGAFEHHLSEQHSRTCKWKPVTEANAFRQQPFRCIARLRQVPFCQQQLQLLVGKLARFELHSSLSVELFGLKIVLARQAQPFSFAMQITGYFVGFRALEREIEKPAHFEGPFKLPLAPVEVANCKISPGQIAIGDSMLRKRHAPRRFVDELLKPFSRASEIAGERVRHPDIVRDYLGKTLLPCLFGKPRRAPPGFDRLIEIAGRDRGKKLAVTDRLLATRPERQVVARSFS